MTGGAWCDTAKMSVSWQHNLVTRVAEPREMDCRGTSGSTLQLSSGRWLVPFSEIFYSPIAAGDHFRSGIGTIFRIMTDNNPIVHTLKIWFGPPIVNFITMFADPNTRLLTTVDTLLHYQLTNKMISLPAAWLQDVTIPPLTAADNLFMWLLVSPHLVPALHTSC